MEPDALPAWAEEQAASWLADRGARWDHVRGVARQAQRVSPAFHPLDGARRLRALGHERLAGLVACHSSARWEAEALGLSDDLAAFSWEDSATAEALTCCDMTNSPTGERITLTNRLAEIAERYGAEHLVVRCLRRAHGHLTGAAERTEQLIRAARIRE